MAKRIVKKKHINNLGVIGLIEAFGVIIYVTFVSWLLQVLGEMVPQPPETIGIMTVLLLLVFSTAIVGSIVFAYPLYLATNNRSREALNVLAYSLSFLAAFIVLSIALIIAFVS